MSIIENFPQISQSDLVRAEVSYEFDSDTDVYEIRKRPATRVFEVRSGGTTFVEGTDYQLVENTEGNYLSVDWGIGGSSPNDGDLFIIDQEFRTVISRYLEAHDLEFEEFSDDLVGIVSALQVDQAEGEELDRIGKLFGDLGKRSGRPDSDYKAYLKSIVDSFSGRGSRAGLKFAISAAVGTTPDNIELREDVENLEYTVIISNVDTEFISTSINDLADLADPSGVELEKAVIIVDPGEIVIDGSSTTVDTATTGLGGGTLTLDGNSTLG
jgi:hypothetical protein